MKNVAALLSLLTLTACCGCMSGEPKMGMGKMNHASMAMGTAAVSHKGATCTSAKVSGMTCEACATTISTNLKKLPGVEDVAVDVSSGLVKIYTDGAKAPDEAAVKHIIERSGYKFNSMKPACE